MNKFLKILGATFGVFIFSSLILWLTFSVAGVNNSKDEIPILHNKGIEKSNQSEEVEGMNTEINEPKPSRGIVESENPAELRVEKIDALKQLIEHEIQKSDFKSDLSNTIMKWENELRSLGAWERVSKEIGEENIELYKKVAIAIYLISKWQRWSDDRFLNDKKNFNENISRQIKILCDAHNRVGKYPTARQRKVIQEKFQRIAIKFVVELGGVMPCNSN